MSAPPAPPRRLAGAVAVGAGIFLSRVAGLVRTRVIAHYLGQRGAADALTAALRIPNVLQNLFGEGVLSASFIPVYARLRAEGRDADATRLARAIGTLLALVAVVITIGGVLAARPLVETLIPGANPGERALTVTLLRITFPGVALLVLSAWCLGVLNSHRKFFLSYASPVLWNTAMIATALVAGRRLLGREDDIVVWLAWGAVIGSAAQFLVQLPTVTAILRSLRPSLAMADDGVRATLRAFVPIVLGRGSVQLSGYIDQALASYLGEGLVAAMSNAQILYLLPVSLFGMAVSAAELPEMSSATGDQAARAAVLQRRLASALRQVVFLVVPSAVAFVAVGGPIVALLFQGGRFGPDDTRVVWIMLAGSAIGLSAGTQGRLLASAFYALGDPSRPLHAALVRVTITGIAGYALALGLRDALGSTAVIPFTAIPGLHEVQLVTPGYPARWGAFGLTASAGFAAWVEFLLLRRWLARRIGVVPIPTKLGLGCLAAALAAGAAGVATHLAVRALAPGRIAPPAIAAIAVFGAVYFAIATLAQIPEARAITGKLARRFRRSRPPP